MNTIIKKELDEIFTYVGNVEYKARPKYKSKSISAMDVSPINIPKFMIDNNIPSNAEFVGNDNGYDAWDDFLITWNIEIDMTDVEIDDDILEQKKNKFRNLVLRNLREILNISEYKYTATYNEMRKYPVYDMYVSEDWDNIFNYYSKLFTKR